MRVIDVHSCLCRNRQRQAVWRLWTRSRWQCNYKSLYTHRNTCYTRHASRRYTKGFSKLYGITYKIAHTTRFMIRRHILSRCLKQAACNDTRASRCVETLIRCTRVAADETYLDPPRIRRLAWTRAKREMNGPGKTKEKRDYLDFAVRIIALRTSYTGRLERKWHHALSQWATGKWIFGNIWLYTPRS